MARKTIKWGKDNWNGDALVVYQEDDGTYTFWRQGNGEKKGLTKDAALKMYKDSANGPRYNSANTRVCNAKFKVGDRVASVKTGAKGEVQEAYGDEWYAVQFDGAKAPDRVQGYQIRISNSRSRNAEPHFDYHVFDKAAESAKAKYNVTSWSSSSRTGEERIDVRVRPKEDPDKVAKDIIDIFRRNGIKMKVAGSTPLHFLMGVPPKPTSAKWFRLVPTNAASTNAVVANAINARAAKNDADPYLSEKLKLMIRQGAVSEAAGGKPMPGDVVFEYRGKRYYTDKDSAHMVKQFSDAGLVKMHNSCGVRSTIPAVNAALGANAVKPGDMVKVEWEYDADKKGIVGMTGEVLKISSGIATVAIREKGNREYIVAGHALRKIANAARNAAYSNTLTTIIDSVKPYMDKRIKGDTSWRYPMYVITVLRKVCDRAVMSAGRYDGKRPPHRIYDLECEKDGFKFNGNLIVTGLLHRDDDVDVSAFDEYDMTLSLMYAGKVA